MEHMSAQHLIQFPAHIRTRLFNLTEKFMHRLNVSNWVIAVTQKNHLKTTIHDRRWKIQVIRDAPWKNRKRMKILQAASSVCSVVIGFPIEIIRLELNHSENGISICTARNWIIGIVQIFRSCKLAEAISLRKYPQVHYFWNFLILLSRNYTSISNIRYNENWHIDPSNHSFQKVIILSL